MNYKHLLTSAIIFSSLTTSAQSNLAYAITGDGNQDYLWMNIRQVDLGTGQVTKTIFQRSQTGFVLTDVNTKKAVDQSATANGNIFSNRDYPTTSFVAAAALDKRSNRLFFTPMRLNELRWVDLDVKKDVPAFYTMESEALKFGDVNDEANHITRMVIAADGYGYAVTNDGNHFIRFSTARKPVITDLGNLVDAEQNNGVSIHNKCSSWGGDMVADAFGKLYIISAVQHVFVVDINSRIATFKGIITGLPAGYTTNGAAVDAEGNLVVSSANKFEGYFKVDMETLASKKIEGSDVKYNASDLANGNYLLQKQADAARQLVSRPELPLIKENDGENKVFPNPVTTSTFNVKFENEAEGNYTIVLSDLAGRTIQTRQVNIMKKGVQVESVKLNGSPAKGLYMVKVLNESKQIVFTEKVMIQ